MSPWPTIPPSILSAKGQATVEFVGVLPLLAFSLLLVLQATALAGSAVLVQLTASEIARDDAVPSSLPGGARLVPRSQGQSVELRAPALLPLPSRLRTVSAEVVS